MSEYRKLKKQMRKYEKEGCINNEYYELESEPMALKWKILIISGIILTIFILITVVICIFVKDNNEYTQWMVNDFDNLEEKIEYFYPRK